jgi:hypothetical protein
MRYKIKVTFGEISPKLRQTNWNLAINNVKTICLTIDIWTQQRQRTSTRFYVLRCHASAQNGGLQVKLASKVFDFTMDTCSSLESP